MPGSRASSSRSGCSLSVGRTADVVAAVRSLARVCDDTAIAGILNRNGLRTGRGNRCACGRVTSLRCTNCIPVYVAAEDGTVQNWLTLTDATAFMGISSRTLRLAVEHGRIEGEHPLPDGPWIFSRQALQEPPRSGGLRCCVNARPIPKFSAQKLLTSFRPIHGRWRDPQQWTP